MKFKITRRIFIAGIPGTLLCFTALFADGPANLLIRQFTSLDSLLAVSARDIRASACDSASLTQVLEELLRQHSGLSAAAFADAGGAVIVSTGNGVIPRTVSRLEWHRIPRKTRQPYYGPLREVDHRFCLIWSRPVSSGATLGISGCAGVIVAYVNIAECLKTFALAYRRPFEISRDSTVFYHTDDWQSGSPFEEEQIGLMGGVDLVLRYTSAPPVPADSAAAANDSGIPAQPAAAETRADTGAASSLVAALPAGPERKSMTGMLFCITGAIGLALCAVFLGRRNRRHLKAGAEASACAAIVEQEKDAIRKSVKADMYREIRSQIGKPEIARIEREVRTELSREIEKSIMADNGGILRGELTEKVRAELILEARRQLLATESAALREEAKKNNLEELTERLRKEVGGQLEIEALQALARTVHAEVRAGHAKELRERAVKELDERIRQEVVIRERAMLYASARASLREQIEKELCEKEGGALRAETSAAIMAKTGTDPEAAPPRGDHVAGAPGNGPAQETVLELQRDMAGMLRKIDESEALSSLAKTVDLLKSSQQSSPYFNLNAAQTSSMIEYLGDVSCRLQGYIAGIKNGINRLSKVVERLLPENRDEGPAPAGKDRDERAGIPDAVEPERETLVKSD